MLSVIGDVHGQYDRYVKIVRKRESTVQLGDFGFDYSCLSGLDPANHKVIGGNHENYTQIVECPNYLGDYGNFSLGGVDFFFYRGAYSIDRKFRTIGIDWWPEEQLGIEVFMEARKVYYETKPKVVLSHDCPASLKDELISPPSRHHENMTSWALEELLNISQPEFWIFGHYHVSKRIKRGCTNFVCLNELEVMEF